MPSRKISKHVFWSCPLRQYSLANIRKAYNIIFNGKRISAARNEIESHFACCGQILRMNINTDSAEIDWALDVLQNYINFGWAFHVNNHHLIPTFYVKKYDPTRKRELSKKYKKSNNIVIKLCLAHEAWHIMFNFQPAWEAIFLLESKNLGKYFSKEKKYLSFLIVFGDIPFNDIETMEEIIQKEWSQ